MSTQEWMKLSQPTVNFLQHVFEGDFSTVGKILTMQANADIDGLCKALESVSEFCQRQIIELKTSFKSID